MSSIRVLDKTIVMLVLWSLCSLLHVEGAPVRKRSISEVQLMHNVGERKQVLERQDWLQVKLKSILIPSVNDSQKGQTRKNRTIFPEIAVPGKIRAGS